MSAEGDSVRQRRERLAVDKKALAEQARVSRDTLATNRMRTLLVAVFVVLTLAGCSSDTATLSDAEAKDVCEEWALQEHPNHEIVLREVIVADPGRLVVVDGEAVKNSASVDIQCAVDIRAGRVVGGFN